MIESLSNCEGGRVEFFPSWAVGVGQRTPHFGTTGDEEDSLSVMVCANFGSSNSAPFTVEPERGQRAENGIGSPIKETWNVLQDDEPGFHFANDSGDVVP